MNELTTKIDLLESNDELEIETVDELIEILEVIKENYGNIKLSSDEYNQPISTGVFINLCSLRETELVYGEYQRVITSNSETVLNIS